MANCAVTRERTGCRLEPEQRAKAYETGARLVVVQPTCGAPERS